VPIAQCLCNQGVLPQNSALDIQNTLRQLEILHGWGRLFLPARVEEDEQSVRTMERFVREGIRELHTIRTLAWHYDDPMDRWVSKSHWPRPHHTHTRGLD
jgi:hypothetical protein